jgi:methylated-DNA-[protein]-cysteine S-methyltransferase
MRAAMSNHTIEHMFFRTAVGRIAIAWSEAGLCEVLLPGERRRPRGEPGRPTPAARRAVRLIQTWARGRRAELFSVPLDLRCSPFARRLYAAARRIPAGRTVTYGELARRIGKPLAARAVGTTLGRNPVPLLVPCHRIVTSTGGMGGFSAAGGIPLKRRLLALEARASRKVPRAPTRRAN